MSELVRQGELILVPVPAAVSFGERQSVRRFIVGHSESGHHHVLDCDRDFDIITTGNDLFVELYDNARLIHEAEVERHTTLAVPPGTYRVLRKRQYNPVHDGSEPASD